MPQLYSYAITLILRFEFVISDAVHIFFVIMRVSGPDDKCAFGTCRA
jgi:hypothetical protein